MRRPRAQSFAGSDFPGALLHAYEGDVHDPDRAHKKRQAGNEKSGDGDRLFHRVECACERLLLVDGEVVLLLRRQAANAPHVSGQLVFRVGQPVFVLHFHKNVRVAFGAEIFLERRQWHYDDGIQTEQAEKCALP